LDYWRFAFAPLPVSLSRDVKWIAFSIVDVLSYPASQYFKFVMESGIAFAVLGAIDLFSSRRPRFLILILPMAFTLLAAILQSYPFGGRLILFLLPATILLLSAGMGAILRKTGAAYLLSGILLIVFFFFLPAMTAGIILLKGEKVEEIRPVIQYVTDHRSTDDCLYLYYASVTPFEFYRERGLIGPIDLTIGTGSWKGEWYRDNYKTELDRLRGRKRVWILFSHVYGTIGVVDDEQIFLHYVDGIGKRLDSIREVGSSGYLYDLSTRTD
jgi:hypothetical protein